MNPAKRTTYIIATAALVFFVAAIYFLFIFQKGKKENTPQQQSEDEIKELSEIPIEKRPYVTLTPAATGTEIIISIENMKNFDKIEYTLTYQADNPEITGEKIPRGAVGSDVNTKDEKFKKSIFLGTASKGTSSPDKGIEDGKLTLNLFQGETEYVSETSWDFLEVGAKTGEISDRDNKLTLNLPSLGKNYFLIIANTVGIPPQAEFDAKNVLSAPTGAFSVAQAFKKADLTLKVEGDKPADLYSYKNADSKWEKLTSEFNAETKEITASVDGFATYVVVSSQ